MACKNAETHIKVSVSSPSMSVMVVHGSKTSGIWQYTLSSLTRCVWHWVAHYREHTHGVGSWSEDGHVWDWCGQPAGKSPQPHQGGWSNRKLSMGVPLVSCLTAYCLGCGPSPVAIGQNAPMEGSLKVQTEDTRYQGVLNSGIPGHGMLSCHHRYLHGLVLKLGLSWNPV
jgi:hypothetical protein